MIVCPACGARHADAGFRCGACGFVPEVSGGIHLLAPAFARGDGRDADYLFDAIVEAEGRHFWFRARNDLIAWAIRTHFPAARTVLDLGCGTGGVSAHLRRTLSGVEVTASDLLEAGLARAQRRLDGVRLVQMDARSLPFEEEFDVIGAFDMLEHIDDDEAVMAEMFRAVRPGGGVVVTVPQHRFLWSGIDEFSHHKRRYRRRELTGRLERAGFRVRRTTSFVSILLPALLVSRAMERRSAKPLDPLAEYRVPGLMNAAMSGVMGAERSLIRAGVSFPAGGSRLAVAVRPV
jgi:SAM-dependent methyltransferase